VLRKQRTYVDSYNIRRSRLENGGCTGEEVTVAVITLFKHKKHFLVAHFGEIELLLIEILENLIYSELSWAFFEVVPLV